MFKSIFAKYVTAFMTIITCGFVILLLVVTSIVSHYSSQTKVQMMEHTAKVMQDYLERKCEEMAPSEFEVTFAVDDALALDGLFDAFTKNQNERMAVWVADSSGRIFYANSTKTENDLFENQDVLPEELLEAMRAEREYQGNVHAEEFNGTLLMRSLCVFNSKGELCGAVAVGSSNLRLGVMVEELTTTVITSALLVLLATLVAAYFITERTIQPLREMSRAAKDFAAGKFDSRVIVRGNDEVAELADAFNHMAESLENLENMRSSFIANVSHDLRTPMTTIAGFVDGILDGVIPEAERTHYLEVVSKEVHRLSRLVASLLDISKIEAGERKFVKKPFDICEMGRVILISFEQKLEEKKLDVQFDCSSDRLFVNADHDAIYQVFYNLCHNAVKFSKDGGVFRISITDTKDKKVRISVYNEGEGISSEDLPLIFDRFYKSDKSRGLDKTGTGLGLYISQTIVQAHGEKLRVESEYGKNCEFWFELARVTHGIPHSAQG